MKAASRPVVLKKTRPPTERDTTTEWTEAKGEAGDEIIFTFYYTTRGMSQS